MTFVNARSADNVGAELEIRQGLDRIWGVLAPFVAFTNLTVMRSTIHVGAADAASTNDQRAMVGQAPYVVNAGVTYTSRRGATSATPLYNRVGERIVAAGERPLPDAKELARDALDFSLRFPLLGGVSGRFDAKNLLDSRFVVTQGAVTRDTYRSGGTLQIGRAGSAERSLTSPPADGVRVTGVPYDTHRWLSHRVRCVAYSGSACSP